MKANKLITQIKVIDVILVITIKVLKIKKSTKNFPIDNFISLQMFLFDILIKFDFIIQL